MNDDTFLALAQESGSTWLPVEDIKNLDGMVRYKGYATTPEVAGWEDAVAAAVVKHCRYTPTPVEESLINRWIAEFEAQNGCKLHHHQADGVRMIVNNNFSILTGGPGTGKTTTIKCAVYCVRKANQGSIVFAAPTGKASRQMTRSTGEAAGTLHSMLGMGYDQRPTKSFKGDILFCDESSMNDMELTYQLFNACLQNKKLVWIGDTDQIPSVGIGAVLRDFIASGVIPCTLLTKTFRQKDGPLLHNIKQIRDGGTEFWDGNEFETVMLPKITVSDLDALIMEKYMKEVDFFGVENVAVLLPYRQAGYCSDHVNQVVQARVNPSGPTWKCGIWNFRKGDPVMQLVNRKDCVNGEVGQIVKVVEKGITVAYGQDKFVFYDRNTMPELALAYAMSVTKSQGSEYASVILCQLDSHVHALNRNILYTGMSRAKQRCTLLTQENALQSSASQTASGRKTFLAEKIRAVAGC